MAHTTAVRRATISASAFGLALFLLFGASGRLSAQEEPLTLRIPFPRHETLNPNTFELGYPLVNLIYDTLFLRDEQGVPQPWLARSIAPSSDGLRVTVELNDATWQDGTKVTAQDIAFTFDFFTRRKHPTFSPQLEAIERVDSTSPTTAVVRLRHPSPGFVDQPLSDVPILPRHLWQGLAPQENSPPGLAVGSGPFRLVEDTDARYRFEANDQYFKGAPAVKRINVPIIGSVSQSILQFRNGDLDMIPFSLPASERERESLGIAYLRGPAYGGTVLMFNLRRGPFSDVRARRAVAKALDLRRIRRAAAGRDPSVSGVGRATSGGGVEANRGYVHPESGWALPEKIDEYDRKVARRELAELNLPPLQILSFESDPSKLEAGRQVANILDGLGVAAESRGVSFNDLATAVGDRATPDFDAAVWFAPALASYDPDFLQAIFGSGSIDEGLNYGGYSSAEFDQAIQKVNATTDKAARKVAVDETLRVLSRDLPVIPLFYQEGIFSYRPGIFNGWRFVKGTGIFDKQSFLTAGRPASDGGTANSGNGSGFSSQRESIPLGFKIAAVGVGLAILVAGFAVATRRRA